MESSKRAAKSNLSSINWTHTHRAHINRKIHENMVLLSIQLSCLHWVILLDFRKLLQTTIVRIYFHRVTRRGTILKFTSWIEENEIWRNGHVALWEYDKFNTMDFLETQRMNSLKLLIEFWNIAQNTLCTRATTGRMIETDRCRAISVEPPALHFTIYVHT